MQWRFLNNNTFTFFLTILILLFVSSTNIEAQDSTVIPAVQTPSAPVTTPETPSNQPETSSPSTQNPVTQPVATPSTPPTTTPPVRTPSQTSPTTTATTNRARPVEVPEEEEEPEWEVDDNNPFELVDYGNKRPDSDETIDAPRDTTIYYDNPFELVPNGRATLFAMSDGSINSKTSKTRKKKSRKRITPPIFDQKKLNVNATIQFSMLLIIAIFLAFLNSFHRNDLNKIYRAFTNNNLMMQLYREKGSLLQMPYIPLYLLFTFTSGMFIYLLTEYYNVRVSSNTLYSILICITGVAGFYFMKHLLLKTLGSIFPFKKQIQEYHFTLGIFNQIIGLALIPIVMLIAFAPKHIVVFAIYGAFIIIGVILIQRFIRTLLMAEKFITFHKFHLIVYLCTVEIAPIFIIIKLIMG